MSTEKGNDAVIREKLKGHRECPKNNPDKCKNAQLAKIEHTGVVVCLNCLSVIPEKTKLNLENVEKVVPFNEDMLFPTSR